MLTTKARVLPGITLSEHLLANVLVPDSRITISDASWEDYERFSDAISEGLNLRVAYDGRDLELMTTGPLHETLKELVSDFIMIVALCLEIESQAIGQTTWKRASVQRGIESDLCFYFDESKIEAHTEAVKRQSNDVRDYPNPDLAVEIDESPSRIDRPEIYAALRVFEIWRFEGGSATIEQLGPDGNYVAVKASRFLPIRTEDLERWLNDESRGRVTWKRQLQEWAETELRSRLSGSPSGPWA
jgi:Uma2 family endonuclease